MPTCDAPRETVWKKTKSPGFRSSCLIFLPTLNCSSTSRGSATPWCANTHCVKPLQSKPLGSLPPLRYGVPRKLSAVSISVAAGGGVAGAGTGAGEGAVADGRGEEPAGIGNG